MTIYKILIVIRMTKQSSMTKEQSKIRFHKNLNLMISNLIVKCDNFHFFDLSFS